MVDLGGHLLIADNGALEHLGEHSEVQQQGKEILLRLDLLLIHIHHVGNNREGIEGDADGQHGLRLCKAETDAVEPIDQTLQTGQQQAAFHSQAKHTQEEIQILKQRQYGDIKRNGYNYSAHISGIDPQGQKIVQIAKTNQQSQIKRLSHGVKQQADYQKYQILTFQIRHQKIGQQCRRKQNIQKKQIGKLHPAAPPNSKSYS